MLLMRTVLSAALGLLLACVSMPAAAATYACTPAAKFSCHDAQCLAEAPDAFRHAESFSYDDTRATLGACLWTACYEGAATTLERGDPTVASALLHSDDGRRVHLSLAISGDGRFTAAWGIDGSGVSVDMGTCEKRHADAASGAAPR